MAGTTAEIRVKSLSKNHKYNDYRSFAEPISILAASIVPFSLVQLATVRLRKSAVLGNAGKIGHCTYVHTETQRHSAYSNADVRYLAILYCIFRLEIYACFVIQCTSPVWTRVHYACVDLGIYLRLSSLYALCTMEMETKWVKMGCWGEGVGQ